MTGHPVLIRRLEHEMAEVIVGKFPRVGSSDSPSKTVIILREHEASALADVLLMAGHERSAATLIDLYDAFAVPCEAYDNFGKA